MTAAGAIAVLIDGCEVIEQILQKINVATILPNGQRLKVHQSTVHVSPNSMTNGGVARNLAFAVDNMTLNDFATLQDRIRIDFDYAVRDVDGYLHRVGYSATVIGTFVQWVPPVVE